MTTLHANDNDNGDGNDNDNGDGQWAVLITTSGVKYQLALDPGQGGMYTWIGRQRDADKGMPPYLETFYTYAMCWLTIAYLCDGFTYHPMPIGWFT